MPGMPVILDPCNRVDCLYCFDTKLASGEAPCSKHSGESSPFSSAINTQCFAVKYVEVQNLSKSHALSISSDSKLHISSDRSDRSIFDSEFPCNFHRPRCE